MSSPPFPSPPQEGFKGFYFLLVMFQFVLSYCKLIVPVNRSDMHRWMAAFPNPTNPDQYEEEVVYEDWGEDTHTHTPNAP